MLSGSVLTVVMRSVVVLTVVAPLRLFTINKEKKLNQPSFNFNWKIASTNDLTSQSGPNVIEHFYCIDLQSFVIG
jgi:hypothetical protein